MANIHFCSEEGMLQGRHTNSHPRLCLDNDHKEIHQKLAIKCCKMPRFIPGGHDMQESQYKYFQMKISFKIVGISNFSSNFEITSKHVCTLHVPNEKDELTSRCLDRKQV